MARMELDHYSLSFVSETKTGAIILSLAIIRDRPKYVTAIIWHELAVSGGDGKSEHARTDRFSDSSSSTAGA